MLQNQVKMCQENSYENCIHYGIQFLKYKNKNDIKNYQEMVDEYKKISLEELKEHANNVFNFSKIVISTLSPNKIEEETYMKIFNWKKIVQISK